MVEGLLRAAQRPLAEHRGAEDHHRVIYRSLGIILALPEKLGITRIILEQEVLAEADLAYLVGCVYEVIGRGKKRGAAAVAAQVKLPQRGAVLERAGHRRYAGKIPVVQVDLGHRGAVAEHTGHSLAAAGREVAQIQIFEGLAVIEHRRERKDALSLETGEIDRAKVDQRVEHRGKCDGVLCVEAAQVKLGKSRIGRRLAEEH